MKLEQFEQRCLADPHDRDPEFVAAIDASAEHRALYDEAIAFETSLRDAFEVAVPADLKEQIKLRHKLDKAQSAPRQNWMQWAMAASLVLTMGVAGVLGWKLHQTNERVDQLRVATLEHVMGEYEQLGNTRPVALTDVQKKFSRFGLKVNDKIGTVTYANICPMLEGKKGVHIIVREHKHPVTVFYMDQERVAAPVALQYRRFDGMIKKAADKDGSWAVLSDEKQAMETVMDRLDKAVTPEKTVTRGI